MKNILFNKYSGISTGLVIGLCLLDISNTAFATETGGRVDPKLDELNIVNASVQVWNGPEIGNLKREFKVIVPPGRPANAPLIIDVHGLGGTWENQANNTRYYDKVGQTYIVYPVGTGRNGNGLSFNAGGGKDNGSQYSGCCGYAFNNGIDDVQFMRQIVDYMEETYHIDSTRIYGSGLSNGSALIQKMIVEEPDLFAAVFVSSQHLLEPDSVSSLSVPVPVMLSYGEGDGVYTGGWRNQWPTGEQTFEKWRNLNGCKKTANQPIKDTGASESGENTYTKLTYTECRNGVQVVMVVLAGGDQKQHIHYEEYNEDRSPKSQDVPIAQWGWDFMKKYH